MQSDNKHKYVLDTSAILVGFLSVSSSNEIYVTPLVIAEVERKLGQEKAGLLLDFRRMYVVEPSLETVEEVLKQIQKAGETANLSPTDISVLALGMEINKSGIAEIITDDYSIQNLASILGLKAHSLATKHIRSTILWEYRCRGCGKIFKIIQKEKICPFCGSEIIRRPVRKYKRQDY